MSRPRRPYSLRNAELMARIDDLMAEAERAWGPAEGDEFVREMLISAMRMLRDRAATGDLKLVNSALKELRHSIRVFSEFDGVRKLAVFGSARTPPDHPDWKQAEVLAERIVSEGWMVITGAGGGIMRAAQGGAGRESSFGVNIRLPFEQDANEVIAGDRKLIHFRYFFTRKVTFVKESHAIALFPGGFGTHDEGFEALTLIQTGKSEILPIVFVDAPGGSYWKDWEAYVHSHLEGRGLISPEDVSLFKVTDDVDAAVAEILQFYSNYHSSRYVRDLFVMRLRQAPSPEQLATLNDEFADLIGRGPIETRAALPEEGGEAPALPRLTLRFDRRRIGRMRQMIDHLNSLVPAGASPPRDATPHEIVPTVLSEEARVAEAEEHEPV